jgi:RNA polymerase sigma factor (sigma-70 family)
MSLPPFEVVVERHGPAVYRVCRAVVGPDAADDAWSETFLSALKAYPALPTTANVEAWLVTIAHRRAIDVLRAQQRRPIPTDADPHEQHVAEKEYDDLWAAVAALPEKQRLTVAYHHLGGLSFVEVAQIVGGTPAASRRAASDGIATLRRTYAKEWTL